MAVKTVEKSNSNMKKTGKDTRFQLGHPALGHRPKGSIGGRAKALLRLDEIMAKVENLELLGEEFQKEFKAKPLLFFKTYVMPLLPKETKLTGEGIQINITQPEAKELKKANNRLLEQLN